MLVLRIFCIATLGGTVLATSKASKTSTARYSQHPADLLSKVSRKDLRISKSSIKTETRFHNLSQDLEIANVKIGMNGEALYKKLRSIFKSYSAKGGWLMRHTKDFLAQKGFKELEIQQFQKIVESVRNTQRLAKKRMQMKASGLHSSDWALWSQNEVVKFEQHLASKGLDRKELTAKQYHEKCTKEAEKPYDTKEFSARLRRYFDAKNFPNEWRREFWRLQDVRRQALIRQEDKKDVDLEEKHRMIKAEAAKRKRLLKQSHPRPDNGFLPLRRVEELKRKATSLQSESSMRVRKQPHQTREDIPSTSQGAALPLSTLKSLRDWPDDIHDGVKR